MNLFVDFKNKKVTTSSKAELDGFELVGTIKGDMVSFKPSSSYASPTKQITNDVVDTLIGKFKSRWTPSTQKWVFHVIMPESPTSNRYETDDESKYVDKLSKLKFGSTISTEKTQFSNPESYIIFDRIMIQIKNAIQPTLKNAGWSILEEKLEEVYESSFKTKFVTVENIEKMIRQAFKLMQGSPSKTESKLRKLIQTEVRKLLK